MCLHFEVKQHTNCLFGIFLNTLITRSGVLCPDECPDFDHGVTARGQCWRQVRPRRRIFCLNIFNIIFKHLDRSIFTLVVFLFRGTTLQHIFYFDFFYKSLSR